MTQSGALLSSTLSGFVEEGLGADWCVSIGNGAVVGVADALRLAAQRPTTRVIAAYMEGLPGPESVPAFRAALIEARDQGKVVIILKSGTSDRGRRAVLSPHGEHRGHRCSVYFAAGVAGRYPGRKHG